MRTWHQRKARHAEVMGFLRMLKAAPCADCGKSFPWYTMDFDHVRGKHRYKCKGTGSSPGSLTLCSWDVLVDEIQKCDVVCAICHKVRTHTRRAA